MPQTIKGYVIEEEVGAGGFGVVYRARQSSTFDREVALKVIRPHYANQPDFIRRFEAEAQLVSRLEHPFIVPLYDYWRDPDGAYLVMRWLRGGSVQGALKTGPLDLETCANIMRQVALALAVAHQQGVIHRDVKPSNILQDEHGNAYLADFGIAKDLLFQNGGYTHPDAIIGSPGYIAPEQARRETLSPRTDVYSLGITLFEMLAGEHPFKDVNTVEKLFKHLNDPVPSLDTLDPAIKDAVNAVIQKATQKNPVDRYADPLEMANAFRDAAQVGLTPPESIVTALTRREQEILNMVAAGKSNKEIAAALFVTVSTVRTHLRQAYKKLNVRTRMQAIVKVRELNLVVDDAAAVRKGVVSRTTYLTLPDARNPYKGLKPFTAADTDDFYGREELIRHLLKLLGEDHEYRRFLAIVGPSGSGKSSLALAGLIPAIWRGELPGSDDWYTIDLIPGAHPLDELEVALRRVAGEQSENIREQLDRDARGLVRVSQLILPDDGSELLIVIDQFEEVFTLVEDEARRSHFLDLIQTAVTDPRSRVRIVVTLRADFYDRPLQYPEFGDIVRSRMETVLPLSAEELQSAIVKPAQAVGVMFADGVVASIIADINYQPGALPLLQYALTELFDHRDGRIITREAYHATGGTVGALAKRAESLFGEFDAYGQELARQVFLRLVTLGEGTEDTRRRTPLSELLDLSDDPDLVDEIVDAYAQYRLLAMDHDPATRRPTVEVAHEAILREWERLRTWLNDSRDDIKMQRQLAALSADWHGHEQDTSYLVRGSRLAQFQVWASETELNLTPRERDFLAASVAAEAQREAEQQAQIAREERLRRQRLRVLQVLVAVFLVAAVVAGGLALFAFNQREQAKDSEREAQRQASIGLAALADIEIQGSAPERAVLLALEALNYYPYTPQAESALARSVEAFKSYTWLYPPDVLRLRNASFSPDGSRVAGVGMEGTVAVWEVASGEAIAINERDDSWMWGVAWSSDGTHLVTSSTQEGIARVWDVDTGTLLLTYTDHHSPVNSVMFSLDGTLVLSGGDDGTVRIWETETGTDQLVVDGFDDAVTDARWSPDESLILSASRDGTARVSDAKTGEELLALDAHPGGVLSVTWSPDGTQFATSGVDGVARVWDYAAGTILFTLIGHDHEVRDVDWSPDGQRLATASPDGTVRVWDTRNGDELFVLRGLSGDLWTVEWSPDADQLVVGGGVASQVWDMPPPSIRLIGHSEFGLVDAQWSPDGTMIATSGRDGTIRVWDATTGVLLTTFTGHVFDATDITTMFFGWSPTSDRLVTAGFDLTVRVWDPHTGEEFFALPQTDFVWQADWSPDGTRIAIASDTIKIIDAGTGQELISFSDNCRWWEPSWSPDNVHIVTSCLLGDVESHTIWDATTGKPVLVNTDVAGTRPDWSPDGTRIVSSGNRSGVRIWDVETGKQTVVFTGHTETVWDAEWSPDGTRIVSGDEAGVVLIWDAQTGEEVYRFEVPGGVLGVEWSPDGTQVIASGSFPTPVIRRVWQSTEELIDYAHNCCVFRELTPEERTQFGLPER